jgi:ribosomal protein S12 methylthiotransferase accessory factor
MSDHENSVRNLEAPRETVDASMRSSETTTTFEGDILLCIEKLRRIGLDQVIVLDITQPGFDISVVKVIVPGLEGYHEFSYSMPGRRAMEFGRRMQQ